MARKSKKSEAPAQEFAMTEAAVLTADDMAVLEVAEAVQDAQAPVHVLTGPAHIEAQTVLDVQDPQVQSPWSEQIAAYDTPTLDVMVGKLATAIDGRIAFESAKKGSDHPIVKRTLKSAREAMVTRRAASVMLACNVDPEIVNRTVHEGSRYNVYAIGKLADLVRGLTDGSVGNAINRAILKSMFQFRKANLPFSMETAKLAASDKIRVTDIAVRSALTRHTVSAITAPTQASSTMQALEPLGFAKRVGGNSKNPIYELTADAGVAHLEARMSA